MADIQKKAGAGSQMRISDNEMQLIKSVFAGNEDLLKLMRKIFLPELDPKAPLNQNLDLWMTIDLKDQTPEEMAINIKARNSLINHVEQQLNVLKMLAGLEKETVDETKKRLQQDSAK